MPTSKRNDKVKMNTIAYIASITPDNYYLYVDIDGLHEMQSLFPGRKPTPVGGNSILIGAILDHLVFFDSNVIFCEARET